MTDARQRWRAIVETALRHGSGPARRDPPARRTGASRTASCEGRTLAELARCWRRPARHARARAGERSAGRAPAARCCARPGRRRRSMRSAALCRERERRAAASPLRGRRRAARRTGCRCERRVVAFLHGFAANLVSARRPRLSRSARPTGQRLTAALEPTVQAVAARREAASLDDLGTACPMIDLCAMRRTKPNIRGCSAHDADSSHGPLRVGIGGPVGSGKTALVDALCKRAARPLRDRRRSPTTSTRARTPSS